MALVAAVAIPAAQVLSKQPDQVPQLIEGFVFFAPGLVGAGVLANLTRALLAIGRLKVACVGVAGSSLLAALAQIVLAEVVPTNFVVGALALGNSIGMIGAAVPMVIITRRIRGRAAVEGVGRTMLTAVAAAIVSAVAGASVSIAWPTTHKLPAIVVGMFAAAASVIAFGAVAYLLDNGDLRVVVARMRQVLRLRPPGRAPDQDGEISPNADGWPAIVMPGRLVDLWHTRRSRVSLRTLRQVPGMNSVDHDHGTPDENRLDAALMTRLERQCAVGIGLAAGIAGGLAVFTTSNQVGTAFLLLISLVFLLTGVEGTPLLRVRGFSPDSSRRRRASRPRQQPDEQSPADQPDTIPPADAAEVVPVQRGKETSYEDRLMAALTDERPL
jgi:hypothetical protein